MGPDVEDVVDFPKRDGAASALSAGLGITVYVVESGDGEYEQRMICGVFSSLDAACASIRRPYVAPPYIVQWDAAAVPCGDSGFTYTGHFTGVKGYFGDGPITWDITPYVVDTNE